MGASVYNTYMQFVCVFNTTIQAFTPKVIVGDNLCPQSLLISLSFTGSEREGTIGLHPKCVCSPVCVCVYVCASQVACFVLLRKHTK